LAIGSVYRPFLEVARDAGVDVAAELARFGLREDTLNETRLPTTQGRAFVQRLSTLCGDGALGLLAAQRAQITDLDLVGYLARHAQHTLDAIEAMARYPRLLGDTGECEVERSGGQVAMIVGLSGGETMLPDGSDYTLGVLFRVVRELSGGRAQLLEVRLPRPKPRRTLAYLRYFGVAPLFGGNRGVLRYDERSLLAALPDRDERLHRILAQRAEEAVASLPEGNAWLNKVRVQLVSSLVHGASDIASIAHKCGVSERTLRRRMDEAGTSFREVSDDVRRRRALQVIDEGQRRVASIAEAAGYSDATAFARAFRRWTGQAPQRYLASQAGVVAAVREPVELSATPQPVH